MSHRSVMDQERNKLCQSYEDNSRLDSEKHHLQEKLGSEKHHLQEKLENEKHHLQEKLGSEIRDLLD